MSKKAPGGKRPRRRKSPDWGRIRADREQLGRSFVSLSEEHGVSRNTIARRAKREGWRDPSDVAHERAALVGEELLRGFIDRDAEVIRANLARKHDLTRRMLDLVAAELERLEEGQQLFVQKGEAIVAEHPSVLLGRSALTLRRIEVIDRSLAGLTGDGWRSSEDGGPEGASPHEEAVRRALDELEEK